MRTSVLLSLAVMASLIVVGFWAGNASSQTARTAAPEVAAIDVAKILKGHKKFNAMMERMKGEVEGAEKDLNKEREVITNMEANLAKTLKPGTPDFKTKEEEIFKRKSDFNYKTGLLKKDLMEKETNIYYMIYKEINAEVATVAKASGVKMVLRYNSDTTDGSDRATVARELSKPIVFVDPNLDMTQYILDELNKKAGGNIGVTPSPTGGPMVNRPTGPGAGIQK